MSSIIVSATIATKKTAGLRIRLVELLAGAVRRRPSPIRFEPSADYDADVLRLVDMLRSQIGASVTIAGPIAATEGAGYLERVILNNAAAGFRDQAFAGETLGDALAAAYDFTEAARPEVSKTPPADPFYKTALEVDAAARIAKRVVAVRAKQIASGHDAANDDKLVGGDLVKFARTLLFFNHIMGLPGGAAAANSAARSAPDWWHNEAAYHALKFVDEPAALLEHVAAACLAEIGRLERADAH